MTKKSIFDKMRWLKHINKFMAENPDVKAILPIAERKKIIVSKIENPRYSHWGDLNGAFNSQGQIAVEEGFVIKKEDGSWYLTAHGEEAMKKGY